MSASPTQTDTFTRFVFRFKLLLKF